MTRAQKILSIVEVSPHKVTRIKRKKLQKKIVCDPGFVIDGTQCRKLSKVEIFKYKKAAKKRLKKLKGKEHIISKKREQSMVKRRSLGI